MGQKLKQTSGRKEHGRWAGVQKEGGQKGQWGAMSNQILPAPREEQRLGVYKMDGRKEKSL